MSQDVLGELAVVQGGSWWGIPSQEAYGAAVLLIPTLLDKAVQAFRGKALLGVTCQNLFAHDHKILLYF